MSLSLQTALSILQIVTRSIIINEKKKVIIAVFHNVVFGSKGLMKHFERGGGNMKRENRHTLD